MAIKLSPSKPDDRYTRMYYRFTSANEVDVVTEESADDKTGWIEFWADDAKACKQSLKNMGGRLYVLQERKDKRKAEMSDEKALAELEEYTSLVIDGLGYRTKAWSLVNSDGDTIDEPVSFENCKAVYGDDAHNLRDVVQEYLKERENFPLRASVNS